MEFNRDTFTLSMAAIVTVILGTLGIVSEQTLQTVIYLLLAAPSFVLSVYATFFKDKVRGGVLVFPQPFESRGAVGKNLQIKGSVMNMGDMPTLVEIFPYELDKPEKTKIWVYQNIPGQPDTKPIIDSRFVLHPGEIYFLELSINNDTNIPGVEIPYSFIDRNGQRIQTTELVEIEL